MTDDANFKLISTAHMPVWDEAEAKYACLKKEGDSVNFALEFEKFPLDAPFDLVDDTFEGSMFNYKGVETDTTSTTTGFSMESYLGMAPYSEYGYFMDQGFKAQYYDDDQCRVLFCPGEIFEKNSMSYQSLLLSITNKSGDAGSGNTRD